MENTKTQWHPGFNAALQVTFAEDKYLTFESEHLLSKKPLQIDDLIIKKSSKIPTKKKLGHIFLGHNIIEYKSPDDNLSINDFYKTYGYACLYQSDTEKVNEIRPDDITITFVCNHYPKKMIAHLKEFRKITVEPYAEGIYHLHGDPFPIQVVIVPQLSEKEYFWLSHLRNDIKTKEEFAEISRQYEPHKDSNNYQAILDVIIRGNKQEMEDYTDMCEALYELFAEDRAQDLIETCADFGASREDTLQRLIKKLSLSPDEAEAFMQKYWK
jgi:hypothetical protein